MLDGSELEIQLRKGESTGLNTVTGRCKNSLCLISRFAAGFNILRSLNTSC